MEPLGTGHDITENDIQYPYGFQPEDVISKAHILRTKLSELPFRNSSLRNNFLVSTLFITLDNLPCIQPTNKHGANKQVKSELKGKTKQNTEQRRRKK